MCGICCKNLKICARGKGINCMVKNTAKKTHGLSSKIQGTYFKISALYFKIYALYFLPL